MENFIAIDFETANPKRVSACALGYTIVKNCKVVESNGFLMNPIGGHAPFQTRIHGIREADTADKRDFGCIFSTVSHLFDLPLVGHSMFDKQVLNALSDHFGLGISFDYSDSASLAKQKLPELKNHKLKTLAKHFQLPSFKHHDATEDARACAEIFLRLQGTSEQIVSDSTQEFELLAATILEDNQVDYKEACQLMYWLEDLPTKSAEMNALLSLIQSTLEDDILEEIEGNAICAILKLAMHNLQK